MNTEQERIERANKWLAEKCGITVQYMSLWSRNDNIGGLVKYRHYPWTIEDPRCRNIVFDYYTSGDNARVYYSQLFEHFNEWLNGHIEKDAMEIACILSIVEQEAESNEK